MVAHSTTPSSPKSLPELDWYRAVKPVLERHRNNPISIERIALLSGLSLRRARRAKRWGIDHDDADNIMNALPVPHSHPDAGYGVTKDSDNLRFLKGLRVEEKTTMTRSKALVSQYKTMAKHAKTPSEQALYLRMANDKGVAIRQSSDNILFINSQIRALTSSGATVV
jgi:hypothetical protein